MASTDKIIAPLTSTDCFILALEKHDGQTGASGNTCRYVLELDGTFDTNKLTEKINQNVISLQLASLTIRKKGPFGLPQWISGPQDPIKVNVYEDDSFLNSALFNKRISAEGSQMITFDIIKKSNGNSTFIFSWNHLIMDSYGAVLYLKQLNRHENGTSVISDEKKSKEISSLKDAIKAKRFLSKTSRRPTSGIYPLNTSKNVHQKIKTIRFTKEESAQIDINAVRAGAKFGPSPFFLACAARTVKRILEKRKTRVNDFWIPVPQNQRKRGASGPVLGNHLSFLFYRINSSILTSLHESVKSINDQMVNQVRKNIPKAYDTLMNLLKRTPSGLYYRLIKGPQGRSLSGFLFTVAEDHPSELLTFEGLNVSDAYSLPPNLFSPGLTFAFMKFQGCLQLMILTYEEILSETEMTQLEKQIRYELVKGTEFNE
jgi:hypothetical protein